MQGHGHHRLPHQAAHHPGAVPPAGGAHAPHAAGRAVDRAAAQVRGVPYSIQGVVTYNIQGVLTEGGVPCIRSGFGMGARAVHAYFVKCVHAVHAHSVFKTSAASPAAHPPHAAGTTAALTRSRMCLGCRPPARGPSQTTLHAAGPPPCPVRPVCVLGRQLESMPDEERASQISLPAAGPPSCLVSHHRLEQAACVPSVSHPLPEACI